VLKGLLLGSRRSDVANRKLTMIRGQTLHSQRP